MKLVVEVEHEKHEIEIVPDGSIVKARVGDREYVLEASEPEANVFLFKNEGRVFEAFVSPDTGANAPYQVKIGNTEIEATIIDPKRLRGSAAGDAEASGTAEIKTAMPGKVVRILVSKGDAVQKGDGVIVVEAMKMQNEMRSPKDGTISEIRVAESDTVSAGDVLVVID